MTWQNTFCNSFLYKISVSQLEINSYSLKIYRIREEVCKQGRKNRSARGVQMSAWNRTSSSAILRRSEGDEKGNIEQQEFSGCRSGQLGRRAGVSAGLSEWGRRDDETRLGGVQSENEQEGGGEQRDRGEHAGRGLAPVLSHPMSNRLLLRPQTARTDDWPLTLYADPTPDAENQLTVRG